MENQNKKKQKDIIEALNAVRDIQQRMDPDQWKRNIDAFISAQPGVRGPIEITNLERPSKGAASGNILFSAKADFGKGLETKKFVLRYLLLTGHFGPYHPNIPAQFAVHQALNNAGMPIAKPLWLDPAGSFFDVPAFIMEYVHGRVPPENPFHAGPIFEALPDQRREMVLNIIRFIAKLHDFDWQGAGLGFLKNRGTGKTLLEKDLSWYVSAVSVNCGSDDIHDVRGWQEWLIAQQPEERSCVFGHGDSHEGNYMYEDSGAGIVSVLDWEMAFLNQREVDVAYTAMLTECFKAGQQIQGVPSTEEMFAEYERLTGYRTENHDYYRAYNLARLAIIFRLATRNMTTELREATRPSWGWFEDRLLEAIGA